MKGPLAALAKTAHADASSRGFYDSETVNRREVEVLARLALIASEVGEAIEQARTTYLSKHIVGYTGLEEEVADILIRVLDFSAWMGIDLDDVVEAKLAYNRTRPRLHGKVI